MFRDPVLRRSVDDGEEHARGIPGQGEPPDYHRSPTQTGQPYQHHSPTTPAPLPHQHQHANHHAHQHHHPPPSPGTTALPPISTALYSRDTSRYYDPTSDNGDRGLAREPARYDNHYPPQVRACLVSSTALSCRNYIQIEILTLNPSKVEILTPIQTADPRRPRTRRHISRLSQAHTPTTRPYSVPIHNISIPAAWRPCRIHPYHQQCISL